MTKKLAKVAGFIALAMLLATLLATQADAGVGWIQMERNAPATYEPVEEHETANLIWMVRILIGFVNM